MDQDNIIEQIELLKQIQEQLLSVIDYFEKKDGFNKCLIPDQLIRRPLNDLWQRYFQIEQHIMKIDPSDSRNQQERAQEIQNQIQKLEAPSKKINTIARWEQCSLYERYGIGLKLMEPPSKKSSGTEVTESAN